MTVMMRNITGNIADQEDKTEDIQDKPEGGQDGVSHTPGEPGKVQDVTGEGPDGYEGVQDGAGAGQDDGAVQTLKEKKGGESPEKPKLGPRRFCELDIPYPEPQVAGRNLHYAKLLLEDYAGPTSELTAVHQYIYHHFTLEEDYPDVAELEECISIMEMRHMELLAETILLLGGDPRFWHIRFRPVYWNASLPFYGKGVCDRLLADIKAEEDAIKQYRKHQQMIGDPHIKALLERIIVDEEHHLNLFRQAYEKYCPDGAGKTARRHPFSFGLRWR